MRKWCVLFFVLVVVSAAHAQFGPFKTPPLEAGDIHSETLHLPTGGPNWAGHVVWFHLLDPTELSVQSFTPLYGPNSGVPITNPFPGASTSSWFTVPLWYTTTGGFTPGQSGTSISAATLPAVRVTFSVLNSTCCNSDSGLWASFASILHVTQDSLTLFDNTWVWLPNNYAGITTPTGTYFTITSPGSLPKHPWNAASGNFYGFSGSTTIIQNAASLFVTSFIGASPLGVEHVPEPASITMLGGGLLCLLAGLGIRRRRSSATQPE